MATLGNYFIDTATFPSATAVWSDAALTTKGPDGWYQSCGTVREQSGGFLLPPESCPYPCTVECGVAGGCPEFDYNYFGVYDLPIVNITGNTGAVSVGVATTGTFLPVAIFVTYDGNTYSELVSPNYGYLPGPYVGEASTFVTYGFPGGSPYILPNMKFLGAACNDFGPARTTENIVIALADTTSTAGDPGVMKLFVPKPAADPDVMSIRLIAPVGMEDSSWTLTNICATALTSLAVTDVFVSSVAACGQPLNNTFYNGPLNGTPGVPGLYDVMFTDADAVEKLADAVGFGAGFYHYVDGVNKWFEIDANSVIVSLGNC